MLPKFIELNDKELTHTFLLQCVPTSRFSGRANAALTFLSILPAADLER